MCWCTWENHKKGTGASVTLMPCLCTQDSLLEIKAEFLSPCESTKLENPCSNEPPAIFSPGIPGRCDTFDETSAVPLHPDMACGDESLR